MFVINCDLAIYIGQFSTSSLRMSANFILLGKHPQSHPSPTVFLCACIRESPIGL